MTEKITNRGRWQAGKSGNLRGRPPGNRAISAILRLKGEETVVVGGQALPAQEALADAIWQFVLKGDVRLGEKHLQAESVGDWIQAVKWLYTYIDPPQAKASAVEPEVVVRVVRVNAVQPPSRQERQDEYGEILTAETLSMAE